jgi:signal peptide peptidase SppA
MIDLPHVAARVFGTPLMMARAKLEVILGVLGPRLAGQALAPPPQDKDSAPLINVAGGRIAVVSVTGTLVSRSGYLDAASGMLSYADISDAVCDAMDDAAVHGVVFDLDSPGGEVGGLFDLIEAIRAAKAESGKPLWAVANEGALSAAYALASIADRIYITRTGEVGSVGVVAVHIDESAADLQAGLAWTYMFAGATKVDGNPHQPLSGRARAVIQADVDELYAELCALVATNRQMSVQTVRGTEAAVYRGEAAVRVGFADRIGTLDQAIAEMTASLETPSADPPNSIIKRSTSMVTNETERQVLGASAPQQQPTTEPEAPQVPAEPAPSPQAAAALAPAALPLATPASARVDPAERLRAEYAEIATVAAQAARLGVTVDAADAMKKAVSADALRRGVLDALATRSEAATVISTAPSPSPPAAGDSAIVRRAKERAAATNRG